MVSDFFQRRRLDTTRQLNVRMRQSVLELVRSGAAHTGMSQGKFIELSIITMSGRIPKLVDRMKAEALRIITDEMCQVVPPEKQ